jgi:hypothetical protein
MRRSSKVSDQGFLILTPQLAAYVPPTEKYCPFSATSFRSRFTERSYGLVGAGLF